MKTIKYQLIYPSGNPTAIIYGKFPLAKKQMINRKIFRSNKLVEQIGYLYRPDDNYLFEMMGGEFSANGCRSALFSLLKFKAGATKFKIRLGGGIKTISGCVKKRLSEITIPYSFTPQKIVNNQNYFSFEMLGNYYLVLNKKNGTEEEVEKIIKNNFYKYKNTPGLGIIFFEKLKGGEIKINPFFWTRETNTLINETACGSGSVAVTIYQSYLQKKPFNNFRIKQPSGDYISIENRYRNGVVDNIKISGPTKFLGYYKINTS